VIEKDVPVELRAIGTVEAYSTVSVKSRIGGYLQKIHFTEGRDVNAGDLLFTIDPRPYQAALSQARANMARDIAQFENAKREVEREDILLQKNLVSQEEYDQARTNSEALGESVKADRASVENAKLQLGYCYIRAPITGRTGSILIHQGNLITANGGDAMVVINQLQPIYINFTVPAQYLNDIKERMGKDKLTVQGILPEGTGPPVEGALTFIDNAVDASTGTIHMKATFDNNDMTLWPGAFVNVLLRLSTRPRAVIVPTQAVMTGQKGQFVFVIKKDFTVEVRDIMTNYEIDGESVIEKGLSPGEQVVTDGQLRLVQGSKVSVKNASQQQ
jgi:multidrug efflux system membrane fusion protein